jgi:hypothetical protein
VPAAQHPLPLSPPRSAAAASKRVQQAAPREMDLLASLAAWRGETVRELAVWLAGASAAQRKELRLHYANDPANPGPAE